MVSKKTKKEKGRKEEELECPGFTFMSVGKTDKEFLDKDHSENPFLSKRFYRMSGVNT